MIRAGMVLLAICLAACGAEPLKSPIQSSLAEEDIRSGYAFLQAETQALQDDTFSNPGLLWVDQGRQMFHEDVGDGACSTCHGGDGTELIGVAAAYPSRDPASGELINLEGRINSCRTRHQKLEPMTYESSELLAMTGYVASLSRGYSQAVEIDARTERYYQLGQDYFFTRRGQFDLSCADCHNQAWGAKLRGDTISQGHSNGFPAYRLEWQTLGSLHRRFRDCDMGIRAEPLAYGDPTYTALELFLASRSNGLEIETPAVRR